MRILLVGDYSAVHKNLKEGLVELGHDVVLFSGGDAWKKIDADINILIKNYGLGNIGRAYSLLKQYKIVKKLSNYDVVQFINPYIFSKKYNVNDYFIKTLIKNNNKSFLLAAGDDAFYWNNYRDRFRYSPHDDWKKYDNSGNKSEWECKKEIDWNLRLVNYVNGVIPIAYDYSSGYQGVNNLLNIIPIPINLEKIQYKENVVNEKVVILHGINREGFKGTAHIKSAMKRLKKDYPDYVEIIFYGKMPYDKYIKMMSGVHINIDQTSSYSYGMNSVISLAMGKVTLSGCEPECLNAFNIQESPVINILPDEDDIYNKLVNIIHDKDFMFNHGLSSRKYVEQLHSHIEVSKKYLNTWENA